MVYEVESVKYNKSSDGHFSLTLPLLYESEEMTLLSLASRAESDSATISASAELSAMECCRCEPQMTAPPCIIKILPLVDWRVSMQPAQSESV